MKLPICIIIVRESESAFTTMNTSDPKCSICEDAFEETQLIVTCSGVCNVSVHPKCSGLKKSEQKVIAEGSRLLWFCDNCKIVGTNVTSLLMSLKSAILSCQDHILKQSETIKLQNQSIISLKDELSDIKSKFFNVKSAEGTLITSSNKDKKSTKNPVPTFASLFADNAHMHKYDGASSNSRIGHGEFDCMAHQVNPNLIQGQYENKSNEKIVSNVCDKYEPYKKSTDQGDQFQTISRNRKNKSNPAENNRKPKIIFGNGTSAPTGSNIKGATRRKWMYVGRISGKDVTEDDIKHHLQHLEGHDQFVVKKLDTKGNNSAFSVGVPDDHYDKVFNPDVWPNFVTLREFNVRASFLSNRPKTMNVNQT